MIIPAKFQKQIMLPYQTSFNAWAVDNPDTLIIETVPGFSGGILVRYIPVDKIDEYKKWERATK